MEPGQSKSSYNIARKSLVFHYMSLWWYRISSKPGFDMNCALYNFLDIPDVGFLGGRLTLLLSPGGCRLY